MAKKKTADKSAKAKTPKVQPGTVEPFTDTHERCKFLDGLIKIVDVVGNIIEDIPQAWRSGKAITTAKHK